MQTTLEFSSPINLADVSEKEIKKKLIATPEERRALCKRFALEELKFLKATLSLKQQGTSILLRGVIEAEVAHMCGVTLEPIVSQIEEPLEIIFMKEEDLSIEKLESLEENYEPLPENDILDLGEIVAQYLSLSLDPYPKIPTLEPQEEFSQQEEKKRPFANLKELLNQK